MARALRLQPLSAPPAPPAPPLRDERTGAPSLGPRCSLHFSGHHGHLIPMRHATQDPEGMYGVVVRCTTTAWPCGPTPEARCGCDTTTWPGTATHSPPTGACSCSCAGATCGPTPSGSASPSARTGGPACCRLGRRPRARRQCDERAPGLTGSRTAAPGAGARPTAARPARQGRPPAQHSLDSGADTDQDDTGWEDYHRQMFDLTAQRTAFAEWGPQHRRQRRPPTRRRPQPGTGGVARRARDRPRSGGRCRTRPWCCGCRTGRPRRAPPARGCTTPPADCKLRRRRHASTLGSTCARTATVASCVHPWLCGAATRLMTIPGRRRSPRALRGAAVGVHLSAFARICGPGRWALSPRGRRSARRRGRATKLARPGETCGKAKGASARAARSPASRASWAAARGSSTRSSACA